MTLEVAIASEQDAYDGEIYRLLLERLLGRPVVRWTGDFVFNGYKSVAKACDAFLHAASAAGIRHALLAVDNDGGARRHPEHEVTHPPVPFNLNDDEGCRECWLTATIPSSWTTGEMRLCVVVPVQVIDAIDVLRARPSFQRFADRVRDW